jgi:RNA polymerase sigma-70 factor (ECF subfamily)
LISAAQSGDAGALRELVRRYQPHLERIARRRLGGSGAGQRPSDLVQDTLERAVRCLHQFQGTTDPQLRRWLAVILQNVFVQQQRAARRKRRAVETVPLPDSDQLSGPDPPPGPSQALRGREAWRALLRAVFALPEGQREAVHRHLRGEAVADIARALGKTPAAVSCLLQRGGKALQEALGERGQMGAWFQSLRVLLAEAGWPALQ